MNLAEILAEMRAHPSTIMVEELPDEDYGSYLFVRVTHVVDKERSIADQHSVCILVADRGEPKETAFYKTKPPPLPPPTNYKTV